MKFTRTVRSRIYILTGIVVILILSVAGCRNAGTWLVKEDVPSQADVMVLLMGNISDRVLQVGDLYRDHVSTKVWIVESYISEADRELEERCGRQPTNTEMARLRLIRLGVPADSIVILPGNASSTREEAETVRDHLRTEPGIRSVLLVSTALHMRRASKIFRAAFHPLEQPREVYCSPSAYSHFNAEEWWKHRNDIEGVVYEYLKLVNYALFERHALRKGH
jgi:uncharacterized SAM-binding protein YcdF (DUF218 family)